MTMEDVWLDNLLRSAKEHVAAMSSDPNLCRMLWNEFDRCPELRLEIIIEIMKLAPVESDGSIH